MSEFENDGELETPLAGDATGDDDLEEEEDDTPAVEEETESEGFGM